VSTSSETRFVLAIHNSLLGVFNYLVLSLPPEWRIKPGDLPSEVYSSTKTGTVRWVREGVTVNYIYHDEDALRVVVDVREKSKESNSRGIKTLYDRPIDMNGHRGHVTVGLVTRGLWKKNYLEFIRFQFSCDSTNRSIDLSLEGHCRRESLKELEQAIQLSVCH
jgi:hypothetical protein